MDLKIELVDVKNLIAKNEIERALEKLRVILNTSRLFNDFIILHQNYIDLKNRKSIGNIDYDDFQKHKNTFCIRLLNLVDKIDHDTLNDSVVSTIEEISAFGLSRVADSLSQKIKNLYSGQVEILGDRHAFIMYVDGLNNVKKRFLTTSYLDSPFWNNEYDDIEVLGANQKLVERIGSANGSIDNGIHRLFIIPIEINAFISNQVDSVISDLKNGYPEKHNKLKRSLLEIEYLSSIIEMKIIDQASLPRPIRNSNQNFFNPVKYNMEIAVYDDFRIDIFRLDAVKIINSTRVFSRKLQDFSVLRSRVLDYYSQAWNNENCHSISYYIEVVKEELKYQTKLKVDYDTEWLLNYDHLIKSNNHILESEKSTLLGYLKRQGKKYKNHLDVGVCTGRYPEELKKVEIVEKSFAIDMDSDVAFWMSNFRQNIPFLRWDIRLPSVVNELKKTFNIGSYDIITCMVSTISHFDKEEKFRKFNFRTGIEQALINLSFLLNKNGILVISTWKDFSILRNGEISLYKDYVVNYLEKHTPSIEEIMNVLNEDRNGFEYLHQLDNDKFNIYIIFKK